MCLSQQLEILTESDVVFYVELQQSIAHFIRFQKFLVEITEAFLYLLEKFCSTPVAKLAVSCVGCPTVATVFNSRSAAIRLLGSVLRLRRRLRVNVPDSGRVLSEEPDDEHYESDESAEYAK